MALVAAVEKPADAQTFGACADRFQDAVLGAGSRYQQLTYYSTDTRRVQSKQARENAEPLLYRKTRQTWPNFCPNI
jgi:hypothetical protein